MVDPIIERRNEEERIACALHTERPDILHVIAREAPKDYI